jgi:hypothetical protein
MREKLLVPAEERVTRKSRGGEELPTELGGPARSVQCSRSGGTLDHPDGFREAGDQTVSFMEVAGKGCGLIGERGKDQTPGFKDASPECQAPARIIDLDPTPQDRQCLKRGGESRFMGGLVDSARESGEDA